MLDIVNMLDKDFVKEVIKEKRAKKTLEDIKSELKFNGCLHCGKLVCRGRNHSKIAMETVKFYQGGIFSDKAIKTIFRDRLKELKPY